MAVIITRHDTGFYLYDKIHPMVYNLSDDALATIKALYCAPDGLTIEQLCDAVRILREDFMLIKRAFKLTHYEEIDCDSEETEIYNQASKDKELRLRAKIKAFNNKENEALANSFKKGFYMLEELVKELAKIKPFQPYTCAVPKEASSHKTAILPLSDWHIGVDVDNFWNVYNVDILEQNLYTLCNLVMNKASEADTIYVLGLGDFIHGIIHETNRVESPMDVIEQTKKACELISGVLMLLSTQFKNVIYYQVEGNHGRVIPSKVAALDRENFEVFIPFFLKQALGEFKNIQVRDNPTDPQFIEFELYGEMVFGVHGDRDSITKVTDNIMRLMDVKPYLIFMGHWHNQQLFSESGGTEVWVSRSMAGLENFSKSIRALAKVGQTLFLISEDGEMDVFPFTFDRRKRNVRG